MCHDILPRLQKLDAVVQKPRYSVKHYYIRICTNLLILGKEVWLLAAVVNGCYQCPENVPEKYQRHKIYTRRVMAGCVSEWTNSNWKKNMLNERFVIGEISNRRINIS